MRVCCRSGLVVSGRFCTRISFGFMPAKKKRTNSSVEASAAATVHGSKSVQKLGPPQTLADAVYQALMLPAGGGGISVLPLIEMIAVYVTPFTGTNEISASARFRFTEFVACLF